MLNSSKGRKITRKILNGEGEKRERVKKKVNLSSFIFQRYEMVKFEKLEAIGKMEENFAEDWGEGEIGARVRKGNIRKGERAMRETPEERKNSGETLTMRK